MRGMMMLLEYQWKKGKKNLWYANVQTPHFGMNDLAAC
jgi:hypothetical protein